MLLVEGAIWFWRRCDVYCKCLFDVIQAEMSSLTNEHLTNMLRSQEAEIIMLKQQLEARQPSAWPQGVDSLESSSS